MHLVWRKMTTGRRIILGKRKGKAVKNISKFG
jgi:hypothetical protein